jgi:hypothetical protein
MQLNDDIKGIRTYVNGFYPTSLKVLLDNTHCPKLAKIINNINTMEEKISTRNKKYQIRRNV